MPTSGLSPLVLQHHLYLSLHLCFRIFTTFLSFRGSNFDGLRLLKRLFRGLRHCPLMLTRSLHLVKTA